MFMISAEQGIHRIVLDAAFDSVSLMRVIRRLVVGGPVRIDLARIQKISLRKFMMLCQTCEDLRENGADLEWMNTSQSIRTLISHLTVQYRQSESRARPWIEQSSSIEGKVHGGNNSRTRTKIRLAV